MFFAHRGAESVEFTAMQILHTFCEQHPDEVMLIALGLFPAMDPPTLLGKSVSRSPTSCSRQTLQRLLCAIF
jgi:hypothetical protein